MWEKVTAALRRAVRVSVGRDAEPRAAIEDSHSITTRSLRGEERGSEGGKLSRAAHRHLLGDVRGWVRAVNVLAADIRDRDGAKVLLHPLAGTRPGLQGVWVETGDDGKPFQPWVNACLSVRLEVVTHPWTGLRGVWAPHGAVIDWDTILPTGVPVLPRR